jgi:hypothetical protein
MGFSSCIGVQHAVRLALDEAQELRFIKGFDKLLAYVYDNLRGIGVVIAGSDSIKP